MYQMLSLYITNSSHIIERAVHVEMKSPSLVTNFH